MERKGGQGDGGVGETTGESPALPGGYPGGSRVYSAGGNYLPAGKHEYSCSGYLRCDNFLRYAQLEEEGMSLEKCKAEIEEILQEYSNNRAEALLPCLHVAQEKCRYLPEDVISFLAEKLEQPKANVYSVASFYSMYNLQEQGKYIIRVCVSLPCYLNGSQEILNSLREELNIHEGETTQDKLFTLQPVSCLGLCDVSPAMMINEKVYGNLTPQKVTEIISQYREGEKEWR